MSRFLLLSDDGCGVGLAMRLEAEGHQVRTWIKHHECEDFGKGLIQKADRYEFYGTVVADCSNFGALLDALRDGGFYTFGGSCFADHLEEDRQASETLMHECGIETPKTIEAHSWEEAAQAVKRLASHRERVVIKPEGKLSGVLPSYVASNEEDALAALKGFEQQAGAGAPELAVQEFIQGVAVSTEGWFNGQDWAEGMFNHTLERKETLNGNLGPSAGCAGNLVWRCSPRDPILSETLTKLTIALRRQRYVGPFDINCVVNEEGVYGLEFTPRFGYDALPTLLVGLVGFDFGSFISRVSRSMESLETLRDGFAGGVRLTLPKDCEATRLSGFASGDLPWFYPAGVQYIEGEGLYSVKNSNYLGVVNGHGETIGEAFARIYDICARLKAKGLGYRTDLAEVLFKDWRDLQAALGEEEQGWLGVDLDGTLAEYDKYDDEIGEPIPRMLSRVKRWVSDGKEVRIVTARGSEDSEESPRHQQLVKVHDWVKEHIGTGLEVTASKDPRMIKLYDDRVVRVEDGELMN